MTSTLPVVIYTQEYPTINDPVDGLFTRQLADSMAREVPVTVLCPIPWLPVPSLLLRATGWVESRGIPQHEIRGSQSVYYPRIPLVPLLTRGIQPAIQALRVWPLLSRLKRQGGLRLLNAHSIYPDGVAAALLARWLQVPLVLTAIGSDINANLGNRARLRQITWAMRQAAAVVGVSRDLCRTMASFGTGARIEHIPNGIDRSRFYPGNGAQGVGSVATDSDHRAIVLFVGRLDRVKGLDVLLDAVASLPEATRSSMRLVLIGGGPEERPLRMQCERLSLADVVQFLGARPHDEIAQWLRRASVFCLPSRNEGMPNVVVEALACGVPVVATRVGGLPELVSDDCGILVKAEDPVALSKALAESLTRNWIVNSITDRVAWADWDVSASHYVRIFREVVGRDT